MKVVVLGASNVGSHFMEFCEKEHLNVTLIDKSAGFRALRTKKLQ